MKGNGGDPREALPLKGAEALAAVEQGTWQEVQRQMTEAGYDGEAESFDAWREMGVKEERSA